MNKINEGKMGDNFLAVEAVLVREGLDYLSS